MRLKTSECLDFVRQVGKGSALMKLQHRSQRVTQPQPSDPIRSVVFAPIQTHVTGIAQQYHTYVRLDSFRLFYFFIPELMVLAGVMPVLLPLAVTDVVVFLSYLFLISNELSEEREPSGFFIATQTSIFGATPTISALL